VGDDQGPSWSVYLKEHGGVQALLDEDARITGAVAPLHIWPEDFVQAQNELDELIKRMKEYKH